MRRGVHLAGIGRSSTTPYRLAGGSGTRCRGHHTRTRRQRSATQVRASPLHNTVTAMPTTVTAMLTTVEASIRGYHTTPTAGVVALSRAFHS